MSRSKMAQVASDPVSTGRSIQSTTEQVNNGVTGRNDLQPSFIKVITRQATMSKTQSDNLRSGDIRVEDIFPGSITDIHIGNVSANKINTGTLDASLVTISSADGAITLTDNLLQIKDNLGVIQVSLGKYSGTNYGLAIGSDPSSPKIVINSTFMQINASSFVNFKGTKCLFQNSGGTLNSLVGYVTDNFVLQGDSTNGLNLYGGGGNICLGDTAGSYGGGNKVIFIPDRSAAPSSNPSAGGIMYAEGGALKWRGSAGTVTTIAAA